MSASPSTLRKVKQEIKKEKKLFDEKVAAVREVVHSISADDVILALHNYDMDVNRTIQAFCEGGAEKTLDEWRWSGAAGKRRKQKRNKKKQETVCNGSSPVTDAVSTLSGQPSPVLIQPSAVQMALVNGTTCSSMKQLEIDDMQKIALSVAESKQQLHNGKVAEERSCEQLESGKRLTSSVTNGDAATSVGDKKKALIKEMKNLGRHDSVFEHVQSRFGQEVTKAGDRLRRAFKEVRDLLDEREVHLFAELERCKEDGHRLISERVARGADLQTRCQRVQAMSDRELTQLRNEVKNFNAERRYEEELGHTIRFQWEPDTLIEMVKNFGEVVPVKPISAQKHSSHSSLVSSVGEDSGLGMVSPINAEETKAIVRVASGGIEMKSDALTAEQLHDINQRLQESLRSQGIDASLLEEVGGMSAMPTRRRRAYTRAGHKQVAARAQPLLKPPQAQISILQD